VNDMAVSPAGQLDLISEEGWVIGWVWYPHEPERRAEVEILADDVVIGSTLGCLYRDDVAAAGLGDGRYGFSFALPYQVLASQRPCTIRVRDKETKRELPKPVVFSQPALRDAAARLDVINQDVQLLTAAMTRFRAREAADNRATAALFRTVADFFAQLADVTLEGASPRSLRTLRSAVTETTRDYKPLDFAPAATPALSVCYLAGAEMPAMYRSLAALQPSFAAAEAELLILDCDDSSDAPLLPLLAGNARYMRRTGSVSPVARYNELTGAARGNILLFLSSSTEILGPWLTELAPIFEDHQLGVLALRIVGPDGVVEHAGAMFDEGVWRVRDGHSTDDLTASTTVDTASPYAFAVRRDIWRELGGFEESCATAEIALAEFCRRAAASGKRVSYESGLVVMSPDGLVVKKPSL
jgi:O-antigen biosynthesis protein